MKFDSDGELEEVEVKDIPWVMLTIYTIAAVICIIVGSCSSSYPDSKYAHDDMCNQNFKKIEVVFPWLSLGCWTGELIIPAWSWVNEPISNKSSSTSSKGKIKTYE